MKVDAITSPCSSSIIIRRMRSSSSSTDNVDENSSSSSSSTEWRKHQLDKLEQKFAPTNTQTTKKPAPDILTIESEDELQPMWKQMESRVTKRRSKTLAETGGKSGRSNIKRTDEEMWLREGLYDDNDASRNENNNSK